MPWNKPYSPSRNKRLPPELYTHASQVYYITIRAYRHQSPFVNRALNQQIIEILKDEQEHLQCKIFTYCLMPDHLHFLISPCLDGISVLQFTDQFKGKATNGSWKFKWKGKLWQPGYYDHVVRKEESLCKIARYILENPLRKGLVEKAEDWEWGGHLNPLPG